MTFRAERASRLQMSACLRKYAVLGMSCTPQHAPNARFLGLFPCTKKLEVGQILHRRTAATMTRSSFCSLGCFSPRGVTSGFGVRTDQRIALQQQLTAAY